MPDGRSGGGSFRYLKKMIAAERDTMPQRDMNGSPSALPVCVWLAREFA